MDTHDNAIIDTLISQNASLAAKVGQLESENNDLRIHHSGFEKYFSDQRLTFYRRHRSAIYRLQADQEAESDIADLQRRRDTYLSLISRQQGCERLTELHPHNGMGKRIRVLLLASGGMGDCIVLTHFAAQLRSYLPVDYLAVGFEGRQVHEIFAGTGLADATLALTHETRDALFAITSSLDIFDMILDVRYAALAFFPPLSRVSQQAQQIVQRQSEKWYRYNVFDWPHLNHSFANRAVADGLNAYSIFSQSLGLPYEDCKPVLDIEPETSPALQELITHGKPVVCLGVGSDAKMALSNGISTKSIPLATVGELVDLLNAQGYLTVQLGMDHEPHVANVAMDLRGKLSVRQSAGVLKAALCFVGVEGGIVHLARAVGTPSVVCFGPTPLQFFGYPGNVNLQANNCTPCWWTSREWMTRCISTGSQQACMTAIPAAAMVAGVHALHRERSQVFELHLRPASDYAKAMPAYSMAAVDGAEWHESRGFAGLFDNVLRAADDHQLPTLARTNVPHPMTGAGHVLVDAQDAARTQLQLLNAPHLLNAATRLVIATCEDGLLAGRSAQELEDTIAQCEQSSLAKGWTLQVVRPKKVAKAEKFMLELRVAGK